MSEIVEIIDTLEIKIQKLFTRINELEKKNQELEQEINVSAKSHQNQTMTLASLKSEIDSLKISNSLLGSEDYKRETKLKINSLIREIDYCIAQLAD